MVSSLIKFQAYHDSAKLAGNPYPASSLSTVYHDDNADQEQNDVDEDGEEEEEENTDEYIDFFYPGARHYPHAP